MFNLNYKKLSKIAESRPNENINFHLCFPVPSFTIRIETNLKLQNQNINKSKWIFSSLYLNYPLFEMSRLICSNVLKKNTTCLVSCCQ